MAKTIDEISTALMKGLYGFVAKAAGTWMPPLRTTPSCAGANREFHSNRMTSSSRSSCSPDKVPRLRSAPRT